MIVKRFLGWYGSCFTLVMRVRFSRILGMVVFTCVGVGIGAFRDGHYAVGVAAFVVAFIFVWDSWPKKGRR
jgi:hypothetical protein